MSDETLILSRQEVAELLEMDACIAAVERAHRMHAEGRTRPPGVLGLHVEDGGFHVKTASLDTGRHYFAAKVNANFPANRERFGLPTIQGVITLFDAERGSVLALIDSIEITSVRTAAATAVAARYLARKDSTVATICGCGEQGRRQLLALTRVREIRHVFAFDADHSRAVAYATAMSNALELNVTAVQDLSDAVERSDVVVTCTTSRVPLLYAGDLAVGSFVAAVGADNPEKQEIDAELLAASTVVVDILEQCASIGDLHHALHAGVMTREAVHAELGEIVAGLKPGRTSDDEVIIFDSTGTALQDVAAAALVYEQALTTGRGRVVHL